MNSQKLHDDGVLSSNLTIPIIDDTIIANLNNIIANFQNQSKTQSEVDLLKSLDELKKIKDTLQRLHDEAISSSEATSSVSQLSSEDVLKSSVASVENVGVQSIFIRNSSKSSFTSQKNSESIPSCKFIQRSPKKANSFSIPKKSRHVKTASKKDNSPSIIQTYHATCRINRYDDKSHTFEIFQPTSVSSNGDSNYSTTSELVIVLLENGETALFASKHGSFLNKFYQHS